MVGRYSLAVEAPKLVKPEKKMILVPLKSDFFVE